MKHYLDLVPISQNPQEAKQNVYFLHCAGGILVTTIFGMADIVHPQPDFAGTAGVWELAYCH